MDALEDARLINLENYNLAVSRRFCKSSNLYHCGSWENIRYIIYINILIMYIIKTGIRIIVSIFINKYKIYNYIVKSV